MRKFTMKGSSCHYMNPMINLSITTREKTRYCSEIMGHEVCNTINKLILPHKAEHQSMKINKRKPHLKWNQGARRGSSQAPSVKVNCRPKRKRDTFISPTERLLLYHPAGGRISLCPGTAKPMRDCHTSTKEKPQHSELPVSTNGLCL